MDRRRFLKHLATVAALGATGAWVGCSSASPPGNRQMLLRIGASTSDHPETPLQTTPVVVILASNRSQATQKALGLLNVTLAGKNVFVQPTLHAARPSPFSTHTHVLATLARHCRSHDCASLLVATRHPGQPTQPLFRAKQFPTMARELNFELLALDELPSHQWRLITPEPSAWDQGFAMPRQLLDADLYIQLSSALATAQAPHLEMALSGARGLLASIVPGTPHSLINELEGCDDPVPRLGELVGARPPDLVLLDAIDVAPAPGRTERCGVFVAGIDPLAVDAVGLALLRRHSPVAALAEGSIFDLPLFAGMRGRHGLISSPRQIDFLTDTESVSLVNELREQLRV